MSIKTVLITGGTGFVGANLVRQLVKDGHRVHLFVRPGYQDWRLREVLPDLQLHTLDLLDHQTLRREVGIIKPEWIFHLAAYGAYSWQDGLGQAIETNFLATVRLVEACRATAFEVFINTGSSSEYGLKSHPASEDDLLEPNSYYALTKASASMFCRYTAQRFNLPIYTLRLYSVFGPYEEPGRLIPKLIVKGLQGQLPALADPDIARDFIFADDVTRAYLWLANAPGTPEPGQVYNVGSGRQTTLRELVETTREIFQIDSEPVWGSMQNRAWDTNIWVANNAKLRAAGWSPENDFRTGYLKTIDWFKQHGALVNDRYMG